MIRCVLTALVLIPVLSHAKVVAIEEANAPGSLISLTDEHSDVCDPWKALRAIYKDGAGVTIEGCYVVRQFPDGLVVKINWFDFDRDAIPLAAFRDPSQPAKERPGSAARNT